MICQQFTTNTNPETKNSHEWTVRHFVLNTWLYNNKKVLFEHRLSLWFPTMNKHFTYIAFSLHHALAQKKHVFLHQLTWLRSNIIISDHAFKTKPLTKHSNMSFYDNQKISQSIVTAYDADKIKDTKIGRPY